LENLFRNITRCSRTCALSSFPPRKFTLLIDPSTGPPPRLRPCQRTSRSLGSRRAGNPRQRGSPDARVTFTASAARTNRKYIAGSAASAAERMQSAIRARPQPLLFRLHGGARICPCARAPRRCGSAPADAARPAGRCPPARRFSENGN